MAYREIPITVVQQLEDIFNIGRTNLRAWHDTLGLGANGVSRGEECNAFTRISQSSRLEVMSDR